MNCHSQIKTDSLKLRQVRASWIENKPVEWVRIHKTPDYAYFEHSAHINAGQGEASIGCESCHGRIDQMKVVGLDQPLNMGWCLDCHRAPEKHLRPRSEVTTMGYVEKRLKSAQQLQAASTDSSTSAHSQGFSLADMQAELLKEGKKLKADGKISPPLHCSGCHR
jgi:hypothetical protein